jgi:hypothetical protein
MLTLDGTDFSEEFSGFDKTFKPTSMEQAVAGSPQTTLPQVLQ